MKQPQIFISYKQSKRRKLMKRYFKSLKPVQKKTAFINTGTLVELCTAITLGGLTLFFKLHS